MLCAGGDRLAAEASVVERSAVLRRLFKEQCDIVAKGGDPVGVAFTERDALFPVMSESALAPEVAR